MEHQTMTTQDGFSFTLTAHELFHQWFGDNVTCGSWEDIWLNEGFASYGEYLSLQAFSTPAAARAWMDQAQSLAQTNSNNGSGTVRVPDTTSVGRIFNLNLSYKKGAAVVHLLRYLCHDDARFYRVLRTYQSQYSGRTARTLDLQRLFEAELGRPLDYFFRQWYRGEGYPKFDVRWNQLGTNLYLRVTETASLPASTPFFQTEVDYTLTLQDGSTRVLRLSQTQASQTFSALVNGPVASITVDAAGWLPDLPGTVQQDNTLTGDDPTLQVYPNPAHEALTLAGTVPLGTTADVFDAMGRRVVSQPVPPAQLDTRALAPGVYVLRLHGPGGEELGRAKFVRAQ
jgi:aminopeptidase N